MRRLILIICLVFASDCCFISAVYSQESKVSARIVGGTETEKSDWPWMVYSFIQTISPIITASSVAARNFFNWVVTAAHCLVDDFGNQSVSASGIQVLVGAHDLSTGEGERT